MKTQALSVSEVHIVVTALEYFARDTFGTRTGQRAAELATLINSREVTVVLEVESHGERRG